MTVAELIAILAALPGDVRVVIADDAGYSVPEAEFVEMWDFNGFNPEKAPFVVISRDATKEIR